jgi:hypothetical protein
MEEEAAALMMLSGNKPIDLVDNCKNIETTPNEVAYQPQTLTLRPKVTKLEKKYEVLDPCNVTALSFENNLNPSYFRNNRSSGQKSLRY